jgi:hypothetical protein
MQIKLTDIPYNIAYKMGPDLRESPVDREQMLQAVDWMQEQLSRLDQSQTENRIKLLGWLGVYGRITQNLDLAESSLRTACELGRNSGQLRSEITNRIRLGHVFHWQSRFTEAGELFSEIEKMLPRDSAWNDLRGFLYQHWGKCCLDQKLYPQAKVMLSLALEIRIRLGLPELIESTMQALEKIPSGESPTAVQ